MDLNKNQIQNPEAPAARALLGLMVLYLIVSTYLFLATLGGAKALKLENEIGNFDAGKEADFVVLNLRSTPLMAFRNPDLPDLTEELADRIFSLIMMGDDRAIHATYILGELAYGQS